MKSGGFLTRTASMRQTGFLSRTANFNRVGHAKERREKPLVPKALGESARGYKAIPRNQHHMGEIARLGCLVCSRPAQAHHVDVVTLKNAGPKVSDYLTAPLCPEHHTDNKHDSAHGYGGERAFWARHFIDIADWINKTLRRMYPAGTNEDADQAIEWTGGRPQGAG